MKPKLAIFIFLASFFSCKKQQDTPANVVSVVKIDSLQVLVLDNIVINASFQNITPSTITEKGFCWSKSQNPTVTDSVRAIPVASAFTDTIYKIGQATKYYFRAYVKSGDKIIYSDNVNAATHGLQISWDKEVNNGNNRDIVQVIQTGDNAFLELVKTYGNSIDWSGVIKIDSSGTIKWDYEYNQGEWKEPNYIMKIPDGYLFAATNWTTGGRGIFLTKIDLNGNKVWEKSFNRKLNQEFVRVTLLSNNTLMLTTKAFDGIEMGIRTNCSINEFLLDLNGNLISENAVLNDNKFNQGSYAFLTLSVPDNGFLTANNYSSLSAGSVTNDIIVQKFNQLNQLSWEYTFGGNKDEYSIALTSSLNGNYDILGYTSSYGTTNQSAWLFEIDKDNGNKLWDVTYSNTKYGSFGNTYPLAFYYTGNQYYVTGDVTDYYYTGTTAYIAKIDEHHNLLWDYTYLNTNGIAYSRGCSIITNSNNEIYVFGLRIGQLSNTSNSLFVTKFKEL